MHKLSLINNTSITSDSLKGQKIVAALYLVTGHLSENDPLKAELRRLSVELLNTPSESRKDLATRISNVLGAATLASLISEKNSEILNLELRLFSNIEKNHEEDVQKFFGESSNHSNSKAHHPRVNHSRTLSDSYMSDSLSFKPKPKASKYEIIFENKNKRQNQILSFINEKKAVGIKDIATLFSDVSEKTIQRELGALVEQGKISKRGSKRWSVYMSITQN